MSSDLNPPQQQAVLHPDGPLLILAGAGSGKTRVITQRLVELLRRGHRPSRILAVTFTNKAAGEMRERTARLLGLTPPEDDEAGEGRRGGRHTKVDAVLGLWIGTFHSICARLLRMSPPEGLSRDFTIFDDSDQMALIKQVLRELDLLEHHAVTPRSILHGIDQAKNRGITAAAFHGEDYFSDLVARAYPLYQQRLRQYGAVDFGDLLLLPVLRAEEDPAYATELARRFDHVLVDEFQDVNQVQYRLLGHLAGRSRQIVVVGDDDQAIYGWRGADVRNILQFEHDWPDAQVIKLERNYRSTQVILEAANAVIGKNQQRRHKRLYTEIAGGDPIVYHAADDERQEARYVARQIRRQMDEDGRDVTDFAVFYRTNAQSRALEEGLRDVGLPYTIIGGVRFYDRAEVKDILAYLRLCNNPADEVALRRVINVPPRGIGEGTLSRVEARARSAGVSFWQALQDLVHTEGELSAAPQKKLAAFVRLMEDLRQERQDLDLGALCESVVERTDYLRRLAQDKSPESAARCENVMELVGSIRQQVREAREDGVELDLVSYLERVALVSSVDTAARGVCLMTVHAAKGLEYKVVFVTGLEEGLFPSLREDRERPDAISEERRLAYVAITRARERLYLTGARRRRLFGELPRVTEPSRFVLDIPGECLERAIQPEGGEGGLRRRRPPDRDIDWEDDGEVRAAAAFLRGRRGAGAGEEGAAAWPADTAGAGDPGDDGDLRVVPDEDAWPGAGEGTDAPGVGRLRRGRAGGGGRGRLGAARAISGGGDEDDGGDLRVEYDEAQDARGNFRLGQHVRHPSHGEGEVRAFSGSGKDLKLIVYFRDKGALSIFARFVEPA